MQTTNIDTRKPLTRSQIIRNIQMLKAYFRGMEEPTLTTRDLLVRTEDLFNHLIEVTTEGDGDVLANLTYKPLEPKE